MQVTITPTKLRGTITPPSSKSQAHRLIIAAALAEGESIISCVSRSEDIDATLRCMVQLGAEAVWQDDTTVVIRGIRKDIGGGILDCGESGSTLRFLIPVALAAAGEGTFTGRGRLMQRPQEPYFAIFREKGITYSLEEGVLSVKGALTPGTYTLPGDVSSQFITGLMYALPLLEGDSRIVLTTALESSGYIDMTMDALNRFGVHVSRTESGWHIPGGQKYVSRNMSVEADYSQSAFFCAAKGMGNPVEICGMAADSRQGDRVILEYSRLLDEPGELSLDVRECPDLVPALAARAALRAGEVTHIVGAARLRIKESDRLRSTTAVLSELGADITEGADSLTIRGKASLPGGVAVDAWGDHRIAMMAAIAATCCDNKVTITGAESVRKSYPAFWADYAALGGVLEVSE